MQIKPQLTDQYSAGHGKGVNAELAMAREVSTYLATANGSERSWSWLLGKGRASYSQLVSQCR